MIAALIVACVAVLFAVIACDEARRLGRHVAVLEDQVDELLDAQVAHEQTHKRLDEIDWLRRRGDVMVEHPSSKSRRLELLRLESEPQS